MQLSWTQGGTSLEVLMGCTEGCNHCSDSYGDVAFGECFANRMTVQKLEDIQVRLTNRWWWW